MYPALPIGVLTDGTLPATGFPVASLLIIATILLLGGLMALRTARVLGDPDVEQVR